MKDIKRCVKISGMLDQDKNKCSNGKCKLHVCTSCRPSGFPRDPATNRPGFKLFQELSSLLDKNLLRDQIELVPTECLSLCPRPCGIALSRNNSWTYLFGDQDAEKTARDILDCAITYIQSKDGFLPRKDRPATLQPSILGRIPPS